MLTYTLQIHRVAEAVGERARIKCVCVVGGVPKGPQRLSLKEEGVACVVGTPGSIKALLRLY
jgi:ATP-dependent RNA helicase DBP3